MKMHMAVAVAVLASSMSSSALAQTAVLEFKGVPLGATKEQMLDKFPRMQCHEANTCSYFPPSSELCESTPGTPGCDAFSYFGPARAMMYWITLQDGVVRKAVISFVPDDYDALVAALRDAYGKPSVDTRSAIQRGARPSLDNRTVRWNEPSGSITAVKRGINFPEQAGGGSSRTVISWGTLVIVARGNSATGKNANVAKKQ